MTEYVIERIKEIIDFSNLPIPELFISLDKNNIYVNDLTSMMNGVIFSEKDISAILNDLISMGATRYEHAENAIVFKDRNLLLGQGARS